MINVQFTMNVSFGEYSTDFHDGEQVRDKEGNLLDEEKCDEETACGQFESVPAVIKVATLENEHEVEELRKKLAEQYQVFKDKIFVTHLDPDKTIDNAGQISVETIEGVLKAKAIRDDEYPGIEIKLNDETVAFVEHFKQQGIRTVCFDKGHEDYRSIVQFVQYDPTQVKRESKSDDFETGTF